MPALGNCYLIVHREHDDAGYLQKRCRRSHGLIVRACFGGARTFVEIEPGGTVDIPTFTRLSVKGVDENRETLIHLLALREMALSANVYAENMTVKGCEADSIVVNMTNYGDTPYRICEGMEIAQLVITGVAIRNIDMAVTRKKDIPYMETALVRVAPVEPEDGSYVSAELNDNEIAIDIVSNVAYSFVSTLKENDDGCQSGGSRDDVNSSAVTAVTSIWTGIHLPRDHVLCFRDIYKPLRFDPDLRIVTNGHFSGLCYVVEGEKSPTSTTGRNKRQRTH